MLGRDGLHCNVNCMHSTTNQNAREGPVTVRSSHIPGFFLAMPLTLAAFLVCSRYRGAPSLIHRGRVQAGSQAKAGQRSALPDTRRGAARLRRQPPRPAPAPCQPAPCPTTTAYSTPTTYPPSPQQPATSPRPSPPFRALRALSPTSWSKPSSPQFPLGLIPCVFSPVLAILIGKVRDLTRFRTSQWFSISPTLKFLQFPPTRP